MKSIDRWLILPLFLLAGCNANSERTPDADSAVVRDTAPARRLGFAATAAPSCVTHADSLDARYVGRKLDTLATANGVGQKRNLATAANARVTAWLARLTTQPACVGGSGTDTLVVTKTDTVTKTVTRTDTVRVTRTVTDTLTVNAAVSPVLIGAMKVDLDSIDNDATAPAYSLRAQKRLKARVDSVSASKQPVDTFVPPPPVDTFPPPPKDTATAAVRAERPRSVPAPVFGKAVRTVKVAASGDLQAALNSSAPGDSIVLAANAVFTGNFTLPTRPCGVGIQIVGAAPIPAAGMRVTPQTATGFPKIISPNSGAALSTAIPTCGWRIVGIEGTATLAPTSIQWGIFTLGDGGWVGGGEKQTTLALVPRDIVLDRVWIHGSGTLNTARCLAINSASTVVINSTLADCHGTGFDSQALEGWNGPGPYLIENNYVEGAGENIMFGGADPGIAGLSPSDITIRRNHIVKPTSWKGVWTIKNLTELKNARRVLYTGNVLENSWPAGQAGMAVVFKSSQDSCGTCTWQGTQDVTFEWNVVRNAHRGLNLQGYDESGQVITNVHTARVTTENNLFTGIGTSNGIAPLDGWLMLLTHDLKDVVIRRNTFVSNTPGYGLALYTAYGAGRARRIDIADNVFAGQSYYAIAGDGVNHAASLNAFAGVGGWTFTGNVVAQVDGQFVGASPAGNTYFPAVASIGVKPDGSTLFPAAGVDIPELTRRTAGVVIVPPASTRAGASRPVPAVTPTLTRADSAKLAHQPKSRDPKPR